MRRRSFLATLPLATAGALAQAQGKDTTTERIAPHDAAAELPRFQAAGEEIFNRPDVHAGDRVSGASFASRSAAFGISGAAGTAQPVATLAAIETLKKGGSAVDAAIVANACLGFLEPTSSGLGGDNYVLMWDPKQAKVMGMASSGSSPKGLSLDTVRSRATKWSHSAARCCLCFCSRNAWRMVGPAPALRQAQVGRVVRDADRPLRRRCTGSADYWFLHQAQYAGFSATQFRCRGDSERCPHLYAGRPCA